MTLVAGVDSSTQSCKVVVRDAGSRRAGPRGPGAAPRRHRGRPGRLGGRAADGDRRRPAASTTSPRSPSAGSSTAWCASTTTARSCARRCCGTTPARRRPRTDLIAELGGGRRRRGPTRSGWCRSPRSRSPSCAGWPSTSPPTRPRTAAVCLPHDWLTWRLAGAAGPRRAGHRPRRRQRHRLLVADDRASTAPTCSSGRSAATPVLPRVLGPAEQAGDASAGGGAVLGPGTGDNAAAALGHRRRARRRRRLDRHLRRRLHRLRPRRAADPTGTVAGFADATGNFLPLVGHPQRRPGARRDRPAARRRPRRAVPAGADRAGRRRRPRAGALPGGRADAEQAATPPARCTA